MQKQNTWFNRKISLNNFLPLPEAASNLFGILRRLILCLLITITTVVAISQKNNFERDTAAISLLLHQSDEYRYLNSDTAVYFAMEALHIATKNKFVAGIANAKNKLTGLYADRAKYAEGITEGKEALLLYEKLEREAGENNLHLIYSSKANVISELGHNYISIGNFSEGLKYSQQALLIREQLGDKKGISDNFYNIGNIHYGLKNYDEALKNYYSSLKISEQINNEIDVAYCISTIGLVYYEKGNFAAAREMYNKAGVIAQQKQDSRLLIEIYNNSGMLYDREGKYEQALFCFNNAVNLSLQAKVIEQLPQHYNFIASIYIRQKKYKNAAEQLKLALKLASSSSSVEYIGLTYEKLSLLDSLSGNYIGSLKNYKLSVQYRDSLINVANSKKLLQQSLQFNFDRREDSLKQKNIYTETKFRNQKTQKYLLLAGAFILAAMLLLAYRNFTTQKKINKLLSEAYQNEKKEMKLKNEHIILNERLRISSDLHDEVGATLSGVAMYSHLVREQLKSNNKTGIENSLEVMQQSSSQMVEKLNDIVWLINPKKDSLQQLISRLEDYAIKMTAVKDIKLNITVPDTIPDNVLPAETRRNIYLLCKEAINNAVKYSDASLIEFSLQISDGKLCLSITDNGNGFDTGLPAKGNGVINMQRRANEIGALFLVNSNSGKGTRVQLEIKITH
jgi:two-component system, NarL family, sensor histidine kinase UhpB